MGSFNSMPKINNIDSQDDGLNLPLGMNLVQLLEYLHANGNQNAPPPNLLPRSFYRKQSAALNGCESMFNQYFKAPLQAASDVADRISDLHLDSKC